ncbi:MAG TPA: hypothetical protein VEL07_22425 [Planctomycetota bacterium]|nr:hypothetical protein [Planctomycetota bacterium]
MTTPSLTMCVYHVKPGKEREFEKLLAIHHPTMVKLGLVAKQPHQVWRGSEHKSGKTVYFELHPWKDASCPGRAHAMPEVMAVWEPMGALCESMGFPSIEPLDLKGSA